MEKRGFQSIINKKAHFDYQVLETLTAGIKLTGPEAKSVRLGSVSLNDSYIAVTHHGVSLLNVQISPYKFARNDDYDPKRSRQLLLKKSEIEKLRGKIAQKGVSLIPLKIFQSHNLFKVEVGIVRGKKQFEKREDIKRKDLRRELEREIKGRIKI